jgi:hypothetical protein
MSRRDCGARGPEIDRREFLSQGARVAAGTALATTALSYGRILGANDRIALGHVGIGNRGRGLERIVAQLKDQHNVEMTAVCDLWSVNRDKGRSREGGVRPGPALVRQRRRAARIKGC